MKIILASSSPRRKELLKLIGIEPEVIEPMAKEHIKLEEKSSDFLKRLTILKGNSVYINEYFNSIIISSDTIVLLKNNIIGKPKDREDAFCILKSLSKNVHEVWTGVSIIYKGKTYFDYAKTKVFFEEIKDDEIDYYLDNEDYMDKAGAYAIQGKASVFVKKIDGCFFNVMGFPLNLFFNMLKNIGINIYE